MSRVLGPFGEVRRFLGSILGSGKLAVASFGGSLVEFRVPANFECPSHKQFPLFVKYINSGCVWVTELAPAFPSQKFCELCSSPDVRYYHK